MFQDPCWNLWGGGLPNSWRVSCELQLGEGLCCPPTWGGSSQEGNQDKRKEHAFDSIAGAGGPQGIAELDF